MTRTLSIAAALILLAAPAWAQGQASVFVIHGIPAADVAGAPSGLPVDVSIGGRCTLPNLTFRQIIGPLQVPGGTAAVAVHFPATGTCSSAAVIGPANLTFTAGTNSTVLAHLSGSGALTASHFVNNLRPTPANRARVTLHHAANAPAVDLYVSTQFGNALATRGLVTSVVNGETATLPIAGASAQFAITPASSAAAAFGPSVLGFEANKAYFLYVVGSLANNSLAVIAKDVSELQ